MWNLNETVNLVNRVERQLGRLNPKPHTKWKLLSYFYSEKPHSPQPNSNPFPRHPNSKPPNDPITKAASKMPMAPFKQPNPYAKPYPLKCFKCNQFGHKSLECPQRMVLHIQETTGESEKETEEYIEVGNEDTELVGGENLSCVLFKRLCCLLESQNNHREMPF